MDSLIAARAALEADLRRAVELRDRDRVEAACTWLRSTGTPLVELYGMLEDAGRRADSRAAFDGTQAGGHEARSFLRDVVARLRPVRSGPGRGDVLVATPHGVHNVLGRSALHHVIEDCGFRVVSAGDAPLELLPATAARCEDPVAVLISLHQVGSLPLAQNVVERLRRQHPRLKVLLGGMVSRDDPHALTLGADALVPTLASLQAALEEKTSPLSPREQSILALVSAGLSNPAVGEQLGIAPTTVKTHLDRIFTKVGASHRTAAVAISLRRGWID